MSSSMAKVCAICTTSLGQSGIQEVTTECGHIFHRECAQKRCDKKQKSDCPVCRKESAVANVLNKNGATVTRTATKERSNEAYLAKNQKKKQLTSNVENPDQLITSLRQKLSDKEQEINELQQRSDERDVTIRALQIEIQRKDKETNDLKQQLDRIESSTSSRNRKESEYRCTSSKTSSGEASSSNFNPPQSVKPSKFYMVCRNNEINTVKSLLPTLTLEEINHIEPNGSTALHAAAYYGHQEIVNLLLLKGAQRTTRNQHGCTPYEETKIEDIKKLFQRSNQTGEKSENRFAGKKGPSSEWIFVNGDPSSYASFNRKSLLKCGSDEEFDCLSRGVRQYYINENGPLASVKGIEVVRSFIDQAIKNNDPTLIVRAYTAETGFYRRLNEDLSEMPTHWSGSKHERNIASIMIFHPIFQSYSFTGETYRGMSMSLKDLQQYGVDSVFMNKTFLSTSKDRTLAESFARSDKSSTVFGIICKYFINRNGTALKIEDMSEYPSEKEILILPYASFKVKAIQKITGKYGVITEIDVEETNQVKWGSTKMYQSSQTHSSVKKKISEKLDNQTKHTSSESHQSSQIRTSIKQKTSGKQDEDDDGYDKMFKDSQEKGKIDSTDLAKWKHKHFGIGSSKDKYAKIWNDAKKGSGVITYDDNHEDSDTESYDDGNNRTIFTASNEHSYATSKKSTRNQSLHAKQFMTKFDNDSDEF